MQEFFIENWESITVIVFAILAILSRLKSLGKLVIKKTDDGVALFNLIREDFKKIEDTENSLAKAMDILLTYVEHDSELKQHSKVILQEFKDQFQTIKEDSEIIHEEIKKISK